MRPSCRGAVERDRDVSYSATVVIGYNKFVVFHVDCEYIFRISSRDSERGGRRVAAGFDEVPCAVSKIARVARRCADGRGAIKSNQARSAATKGNFRSLLAAAACWPANVPGRMDSQ